MWYEICVFFFSRYAGHRDLHVLTHSFPTRRSPDLDHDAEQEADRDADEPDGDRDAGAVEDPSQHVPPEPVGAEQEERPPFGRAEEVQIGLDRKSTRLNSSH